MRYPYLCVCWVWDRDYVSQLPCVRYYVFVKSSFKHTHEECESKSCELVFFYVLLHLGPERW